MLDTPIAFVGRILQGRLPAGATLAIAIALVVAVALLALADAAGLLAPTAGTVTMAPWRW